MARIALKVVVDMETMRVVEHVSISWDGPVDLCKGPSKDEMNTQNAIQQSQLAAQQQQLALQQAQFNMVDPSIQKIIANGGLSPEATAALTSNAMNTLPNTYKDLYGQLSQQLVARGVTGGQNAGGGDIARQFGSLGAQEAGQQSQLLSQIPLMKEQGLYQAFNTALGVGNQFGQNVGTFGAGASNAGQSATSAANAATQASTGFWGSLFGALSTPFTGLFEGKG